MIKKEQCIRLDGSALKLLRHPKKELVLKASKIASQDSYAKLFPKDSRKDVIYFSGVSFTIGHINKNNCLVLPDEGMAMYKTCTSTPLDIEHETDKIVGFCVNTYLCNLKNDKILSDDGATEILDAKGLVNVGVVMALWKINNPELAQLVEENFDENSDKFDKVKLSFECYFTDFDFFVSNGDSDYPNGEIVSSGDDNPNADAMYESLKTNGGSGRWMGNRISICPKESFLGGTALTLNPANEFSDLTAKQDDSGNIVQNTENNSKNEIKSVNIDTTGENIMSEPIVTKPTEVVPAVVETKVEASVVQFPIDADFAKAMQEHLDLKIKELGAKDDEVKQLKAAIDLHEKNMEVLKAEFKQAIDLATKVQTQLDSEIEARSALETKEAQRKQKELVASRLDKIGEFVTITDENRVTLEKECAEASEEDFNSKLKVYEGFASNKIVASETPTTPSVKEGEVQESVTQVVTETVATTKSVNIIANAPSDTLRDKFAKAFNTVKTLGF